MNMDLQMSNVIELALNLMERASITPHDAGCQAIISQKLTNLGFQCESIRIGEVDNLYARFGKESPLIVFVGHTDVVPTGPETDWISPPFEPEVREGILYGRGASDMKGAIAAMITAVESFLSATPDPTGSIGFLITSDEEGPAIHGTKEMIQILEHRGEKIDYCIVGEPSSDKKVGDQIRIGRRGSLTARILIHGKQGHVAHPHLAKNPIHMSAQALVDLVQTEWDKGNQDFPPTTFQISNIHAGTGATNVIPGRIEIVCNFRFSTAITIEQIQERTEEMLNKYNLSFDIDWTIGAEPFLTKHGKLIKATQLAIENTTGIHTKLSTGGGTSDGRFIAKTGAEVVELGVSHATAHHVNENVKVIDLEVLSECYTKILMELL